MSGRSCKAVVLLIVAPLALPSLTRVWAAKPTTRTQACVAEGCHDTYQSMKHVHQPVASGVCKFCHRAADPAQHTFKLLREGGGLCEYCHWDREREIEENGHRSLGSGECVACHNPHAGNYPALLPGPKADDACRNCHANLLEGKKVLHNPAASGECTACHDPHRSDHGKLLKAPQGQLCLTCHDREMTTQKGDIIPNVKAQIEGKKFLHGPVARKDCGTCHVAHGSDHFRLLTGKYPAEFYAPFSIEAYELCFTCHSEEITLTRETASLTEFRNGSLNLHYVHVNKPDRGRTCRSCHATHASDQPKHIRESVPFGNWEIPLRYDKTKTGGNCNSGCHEPRAYDRETPVKYRGASSRGADSKPSERISASRPQADSAQHRREQGVTGHTGKQDLLVYCDSLYGPANRFGRLGAGLTGRSR